MLYPMYRFQADGRYAGEDATLSDHEIDLAQYTPPAGYAWEKPPAVQADEVPVWNGKAWEIRKLADYEPKVPTLEEVKADKLAELAQARWEQETGGLTLPTGAVIKTDRESQGLLTAAAVMAKFDPTMTVEWKAATGWIDLDATTVIQLAGAVREHVQKAFSKERDLAEQVAIAGSVQEVEGVVW